MEKLLLNVLNILLVTVTAALAIHYFFGVDSGLSLAFGWVYGSLTLRLNDIENSLKDKKRDEG